MWCLSSPFTKTQGFKCYFAASDVTVCSNSAGILQSGTSLHVASSWLARLSCWALPFQGRLCPAMVSSTWLILSPRGKSIQKGASLGKFCFFCFFLFDYVDSNIVFFFLFCLANHSVEVIGKREIIKELTLYVALWWCSIHRWEPLELLV